MNPRQMRMAMKKLGIKQQEIEAEQVIIKTKNEDIIINQPQISKINMMGQWTYQISGEEQRRPHEPSISIGDVKTVMEQASVSEETARQALRNADGDLALAIINLQE